MDTRGPVELLRHELARWRAARRGPERELRLQRLEALVARQAEELGYLQRRPLDAIAPTMAWIEQATLRSSPLISVVLATRDRAAHLRRAIDSVLAQTYDRFELLVVDDASEDETAAVIAAVRDGRVRGLGGAGRGPHAARNAGVDAARGELIAYLDDDNAMHPGWLKSVAWAFEQWPEAEVVYGGIVTDDPARLRGGPGGAMPVIWFYPYDRAALSEANLGDTSAISHRAGLGEARWDEDLPTMGDWDLLARLTTERDPVALPAIACFYSTDAPRRLSTSGTLTDAETIRRRARVARGLVAPATPIRNPGPLLARVLSEGPLELGEWALSPSALELVLSRISGPGQAVVECGAGESSIAIGRRLRAAGGGRLQALEHHPGWAAQIRDRVAGERLTEWVEVIDAPLRPHELALDGCRWYAAEGLERLGRPIDLLLVDGPPADRPGLERARYPALPALAPFLAEGATIVLDDLDRAGERWVVDHWEAVTGARFERLDEEGVAICVFSAPQGGNSISREV